MKNNLSDQFLGQILYTITSVDVEISLDLNEL